MGGGKENNNDVKTNELIKIDARGEGRRRGRDQNVGKEKKLFWGGKEKR